MRKIILTFIVIGIIILIMSNIRIALPITNVAMLNFNDIVNVRPD